LKMVRRAARFLPHVHSPTDMIAVLQPRGFRSSAGAPLCVECGRVRERWEIVSLAVRLADDVPGERPRLLRRLRMEFARREKSQ
jgi:hypothetical protein